MKHNLLFVLMVAMVGNLSAASAASSHTSASVEHQCTHRCASAIKTLETLKQAFGEGGTDEILDDYNLEKDNTRAIFIQNYNSIVRDITPNAFNACHNVRENLIEFIESTESLGSRFISGDMEGTPSFQHLNYHLGMVLKKPMHAVQFIDAIITNKIVMSNRTLRLAWELIEILFKKGHLTRLTLYMEDLMIEPGVLCACLDTKITKTLLTLFKNSLASDNTECRIDFKDTFRFFGEAYIKALTEEEKYGDETAYDLHGFLEKIVGIANEYGAHDIAAMTQAVLTEHQECFEERYFEENDA